MNNYVRLVGVVIAVIVMASLPAMAQTVTQVSAGENTLYDAITAASDGDILELVDAGGVYLYTMDNDKIEISKVLTIRAMEGLEQKPIIRSLRPTSSPNTRNFEVLSGGSLTLIGLEFDGSGDGSGTPYSKQAIRLNAGDSSNVFLKIYDCYFHDYTENFLRGYTKTVVDTFIIQNTVSSGSVREGWMLYDTSSGGPALNYALFENVTITNVGREAIKIGSADVGYNPEVIINHVTMDSTSLSGDYRVIRTNAGTIPVANATIKNCIISNQMGVYQYSLQLYGTSTVSYCDTFNVRPIDLNESAAIGSGMIGGDPLYADPANGDYTLQEGSPALGMADDGKAMGDLRWDPYAQGPTVHKVKAGENTIYDAVEAAADGDIIELVDAGGVYVYTHESDKIEITKVLTIRAKEGLTQKPIIRNLRPTSSANTRNFEVLSGGSLTLIGLEFDGSGDGSGSPYSKQAVRLNAGDSTSVFLKINDCYFHDYTENFLRGYIKTVIDTLIIQNTLSTGSVREGWMLYDTSSDGPAVNYALFENITISNVGREAIKIGSAATGYNPEVIINHVTMDSTSLSGDYRVIRTNAGTIPAANVTIKNCIISNQMGAYQYSLQLYGTSTVSYSDTFNVRPVDLNESASIGSGMIGADPLYKDPGNLDYRLALTSPARGAADDGKAMGDLRWETDPNQYLLTLFTDGEGTLEASPAGPYYDPGTVVTLTAKPAPDWKVSKWEPAAFPPDTETRDITMNSDQQVKVFFVPLKDLFNLTVSTIGIGHVDLAPEPVQADSAAGVFSYYDGTNVTLTAVSDTSAMEFTEWSGDLTGSNNPETVSVTSNLNITATFAPTATQYKINVTVVGKGEVSYDPEPYPYYDSYDSSTVVTMVAAPLSGFEFTGWSGDVTSDNDTVIVTMNTDFNLTVTFSEISVPGGILEIDTTQSLAEAVDFARNNSQVKYIVLTTSGGIYKAHENIDVDFPLAIMAKEGLAERPKIEGNPDLGYANGIFQIRVGGTSLSLDGIELYDAKYAIRTDDDSLKTEIRINNCYIYNSGEVWVKIYAGSFVDSLIITNSIFRECKNEGIYLRDPNTVKYARIENTTFIRSGREAVRVRDNGDMVLRINHCTIDSASWNQNYRVLYPEGVQDAEIKNCIITNQMFLTEQHSDVIRLYGTSTAAHLVLNNTSTRIDLEEDATVDTTLIWEFDPLFESPESRNYTLLPASHAYDIGDDGEAAGDLRWATNTPTHFLLTVTVEGEGTVAFDPAPVGKTYDPDQTVTITAVADTSYEFVEWTGDLTGSVNPETIVMNGNKTVGAKFQLVEGIEDLSGIPTEYALYQNYPNPFNPQTTIRFDLKKPGKTTIKVYDILGREIFALVDKQMPAGKHKIIFNHPELATGLYFYRIQSEEFSDIKKMMLIK